MTVMKLWVAVTISFITRSAVRSNALTELREYEDATELVEDN
jgi:hypothetical protein